MPHVIVNLVIDACIQDLCVRPYPGHKQGCPNYNHKSGCPPQPDKIDTILSFENPIWAVYNVFLFGKHCERMRVMHPQWSERQVQCCLYWQNTARKQLRIIVNDFSDNHPGLIGAWTPEANGVNVTETMCNVGIDLEWPPKTVAYQVVLVGTPVGKSTVC